MVQVYKYKESGSQGLVESIMEEEKVDLREFGGI